MLFWLIIILNILNISFIIFISIARIKTKWKWINPRWEINPDERAAYIEILLGVFLFVSILSCTIANITSAGKKAEMIQTYDALVYKMNSPNARDEFGIMNKSIVDEIQTWNEELAYGKNMEHNFWIGAYIPNIYDDFEYIKYN